MTSRAISSVLLSAFFFVATACDSSTGTDSAKSNSKADQKGDKDNKSKGNTEKSGDKGSKRTGKVGKRHFEVKAIDGVDVFFSTGTGKNKDEALHSGKPRVVDGCLFVGDALVVWPAKDADKAKEALAAAESGDDAVWKLSGGGLSVKEGDAKLDVDGLDVKCEVDEVWFAGEVSKDKSKKPGKRKLGKIGERAFEVKKMDGVDVLLSTSKNGNKGKALHSGAPRVVKGCLFVGDALVIWPGKGDLAKEALAQAKAKSDEVLELGGAGLSVKEGDDEIDIDGLGIKCELDEVWFAGP